MVHCPKGGLIYGLKNNGAKTNERKKGRKTDMV
jgi:hypothetical protein